MVSKETYDINMYAQWAIGNYPGYSTIQYLDHLIGVVVSIRNSPAKLLAITASRQGTLLAPIKCNCNLLILVDPIEIGVSSLTQVCG